jgi:hypothetical protein
VKVIFPHFFPVPDLETIDDDAEKSNIKFVKINDKRFGKSFGIKKFPALSFFRDKNIVLYQGDLKVIILHFIYKIKKHILNVHLIN